MYYTLYNISATVTLATTENGHVSLVAMGLTTGLECFGSLMPNQKDFISVYNNISLCIDLKEVIYY